MAKVFSPRLLGVVPGFVFQQDTTLSEPGYPNWVLEGWHCITTNWSTNWTVAETLVSFMNIQKK